LSEIVKDEGVVLRTYDFLETSMIVSLFTRRRGKIRLIAKGARRKGFPGACLRLGTIGEFVYYLKDTRKLQLLKEVDCRDGVFTEDANFEALCILQAGLDIIDRLTEEGGEDEENFDLLKGFIRNLAFAREPWAMFFAFEIGFLRNYGLYPSSSYCARCGVELKGNVFVESSVAAFLCEKCAGKSAFPLKEDSFEVLRRMESGSIDSKAFETIRTMTIGEPERKEIGRMLHRVFQRHMERYRLPGSLKMLGGVS